MKEMSYQQYIEKMQDAQNEGVPVNWESVANNLAVSANHTIQLLHKEIADLKDSQTVMDLGMGEQSPEGSFKGPSSQ
jgi:hypothetical protein